jgi:hypothetical protein
MTAPLLMVAAVGVVVRQPMAVVADADGPRLMAAVVGANLF